MLSVVAASRNDGHGANLLPRMQVFIDGLAEQAERHRREVELILVEWNPPPDRAPLSEVLSAPAATGFSARIITVPAAAHARLAGSSELGFFQMIAKNVGIRRARGVAVLATNIDILLSDELFLESSSALEDRCVYRADRADIAFDPGVTVDPRRLRQSAPVRINRKDGIYYPGAADPAQRYVHGGGSLARVALRDPRDFVRRLVRRSGGVGRLTRYRRAFVSIFALPHLHLNACGDFTLMKRESWQHLHGYPEWEMFSWNLDSVLLYQAAAAGYAFKELSEPAFHLEHSAGFSLESQGALFDRLRLQGIPVLTDVAALEVDHTIWNGRKRGDWRTNLDGWGLATEDFPEFTLPVGAGAPQRHA
jgi:hypothetical protein